jgi:hypothetical protein
LEGDLQKQNNNQDGKVCFDSYINKMLDVLLFPAAVCGVGDKYCKCLSLPGVLQLLSDFLSCVFCPR